MGLFYNRSTGITSHTKSILRIFVLSFFLLSPILLAQVTVTHGPIVGGVTGSSARFIVRTDSSAEISIRIDTDSSFSAATVWGPASTLADENFFVSIDVDGLTPETKYYYCTIINEVVQPAIRSFSTFPPKGTPSQFLFQFGSGQQCPYDEGSYFGYIFPVMAKENPLFFLQIGDWNYPDTTDSETDQNYFSLVYERVLAAYESRYDPTFPLDELLKVTAVDYIIDDHDLVNDNCDRTYPGIANSLRGYSSAFPHYPLERPGVGLWHKFSCGSADFFVVDTRTQRDPNINTFDSVGTTIQYTYKPEHCMLAGDEYLEGEDQIEWLLRELEQSQATWKFIVTTVAFNPCERATLELALLLQGTALDPLDVPGQGLMTTAEIAIAFSDRWGGFPASSQKIISGVHDRGIENVIVLSGDSHNAGIDDGLHSFFPELMAGGLDRSNSYEILMEGQFNLRVWNQGGQYAEANNLNNAYGRVTVFGDDSVRLEAVDEFEEIITNYTVLPGYTVETVGIQVAPEIQNFFGEVDIGQFYPMPVIIISTGCDTLELKNITITGSGFTTLLPPEFVAPGIAYPLLILFKPTEARVYQEELILETNSPAGTVRVPLIGLGVDPSGVNDTGEQAPAAFNLAQNYPNPFNPETSIAFSLDKTGITSLLIFNINGRQVRSLLNSNYPAGNHRINWDGKDEQGNHLSSGIYWYKLQSANKTAVRKMILLK